MSEQLLRSPLEAVHVAHGARLVPFAGWNMPVQYTSILQEHHAVRRHCGIFDISHMGLLEIEGEGALNALESLLSNSLARLEPGHSHYTFLLNERGGVIDDLIAYRSAPDHFYLVVNASKTTEDRQWLTRHLPPAVTLSSPFDTHFGLAIQGPASAALFEHVFPGSALPPRNAFARLARGHLICRTGYTGEDGYEIFGPADDGPRIFEAFVASGARPCGLGARDTLRLESAYPLNGNDLSPDRSPLAAGLGAFVDLNKPNLMGREALLAEQQNGIPERLCAILLEPKAPPPRAHYPVYSAAGELLGELSSGALSPSLERGIALAYLPRHYARPGTPLSIDIRGRRVAAVTVKKPFYHRS